MKILLINPPIRLYKTDILFPSGLAYVAGALLKSKYEVEVIDINAYRYSDKELINLLKKMNPDVVGIGGIITTYNSVKKIIRIVKTTYNNKVPVIGGGSVASSIPETALRHLGFDLVVIGEGDITVIEIMEFYEGKRKLKEIKGIAYIENGKYVETEKQRVIYDLDNETYLNRNLFPIQKYVDNKYMIPELKLIGKGAEILSGRGCAFKCRYCYQPMGRTNRLRSIDSVFKEIFFLKKNYDIKVITFLDDLFTINIKRLKEFCNRIINHKIDIYWTCNMRANQVSEEIITLMKKANCVEILMGIDSGSQVILNDINKGIKVEDCSKAIEIIKKSGIILSPSFLFGMPAETKKTLNETLNFIKKHNVFVGSINFAVPFPGTPLYTEYKDKLGMSEAEFCEQVADRDCEQFFVNLTELSPEYLIEFQRIAIKEIYNNVVLKNIIPGLKTLKNKKVAIYGADITGLKILKLTEKFDVEVSVVVDGNETKHYEKFMNYIVQPPEKLANYNIDAVIICSIRYYYNIKKKCIEILGNGINIFGLRENAKNSPINKIIME